jgi:hypothetical protein
MEEVNVKQVEAMWKQGCNVAYISIQLKIPRKHITIFLKKNRPNIKEEVERAKRKYRYGIRLLKEKEVKEAAKILNVPEEYALWIKTTTTKRYKAIGETITTRSKEKNKDINRIILDLWYNKCSVGFIEKHLDTTLHRVNTCIQATPDWLEQRSINSNTTLNIKRDLAKGVSIETVSRTYNIPLEYAEWLGDVQKRQGLNNQKRKIGSKKEKDSPINFKAELPELDDKELAEARANNTYVEHLLPGFAQRLEMV